MTHQSTSEIAIWQVHKVNQQMQWTKGTRYFITKCCILAEIDAQYGDEHWKDKTNLKLGLLSMECLWAVIQ